jgi:hypothetical protein
MTTEDPLRESVSALVEAARGFQRASEARGGHLAAPEALTALQEALQLVGGAWYRLASDAVPAGGRSDGGLSREQEVRLIGALHDVAAAFGRCAAACRGGRSVIAPILARGAHARRSGEPVLR